METNRQIKHIKKVWDIIYDTFLDHYEERVCDVSNVDLKYVICDNCKRTILVPKQCYCDDILNELRKRINKYIDALTKKSLVVKSK